MAVDGYVDVESNNISRRFLHSYYKPSSRSVFMFKPSQRSRYLFRTNDRRILKQNIESQLYSTSGGLKREKVEDYFFLHYLSRWVKYRNVHCWTLSSKEYARNVIRLPFGDLGHFQSSSLKSAFTLCSAQLWRTTHLPSTSWHDNFPKTSPYIPQMCVCKMCKRSSQHNRKILLFT